jgi:autotransporter strand-loop-strand O-heptosyltransferase
MKPDIIVAHCSFIGHTGYANHTREFFTHLNKYIPVRVRNYTHVDDVSYLTQEQQDMIVNNNNELPWDIGKPFDISKYKNPLNIVLNTTNHPYFYDKYNKGPVIFYNVWESTRQPDQFFNKMLEADQFWCPSEWQKMCTAEQGYPIDKIKVVPEGIDPNVFKPAKSYQPYVDGHFRFLLFGRWEHRKSTTEIIRTFLQSFKKDDKVRLVLSVDNNYAVDGMSSTEERLKHYGWDKDPRLEVVHFIPFDEYLDYLQTGDCLVSCSRSEGWNLPLMEAIACGTPAIHSDFSGQLEFAKGVSWRVNIKGYKPPEQMYGGNAPGLWAEPDFKHLSSIMKFVYKKHSICRTKAVLDSIDIRKKYSWDTAAKIALKHIEELKTPEIAHIALKEKDVYSDINKNISPTDDDLNENKKELELVDNTTVNCHFVDGPFLELLGTGNKPYTFLFSDENGTIDHTTSLTPNNWARSNRKWFTNWVLSIRDGEKTMYEHKYDAKGKKVLISFDSKSLGDNLAWIPYCEKFRIKHRCRVIVSTFWNHLFKEEYKGLEFVPPGTVTQDLYASYMIGCWDGDLNKNKFDWRETPIQKICSDILGLEYEEIKPRIKRPDKQLEINKPLVTISEGSTAGCKQYQYPGGWQVIVDYLKEEGYDVAVISKEKTTLEGIINLTNKPIEDTMSAIASSDFYMGVSSGPSWLAWALGIPVVMISGCTNIWNEFQSNILRIKKEDVCHGCMNNKNIVFDRGEWHWCLHQDSPKHYECTRSIPPQMIIDEMEKKQWGAKKNHSTDKT